MLANGSGEGVPSKKRKFQKGGCATCCCCFAANKNDMEDKENEPPTGNAASDFEADVQFHGELPKDLRPGKAITLKVFIHPGCLRFSIDLLCANKQQQPSPDIGFHFNPRLEQRYVVRNCRLNGHWGLEETTSSREFAMERNETYDMTILIAEGQFLVSVNGRHFCAFTYRVPLSQLDQIEVRGAVDVYSVDSKEMDVYPEEEEVGGVVEVVVGTAETVKATALPVPYTGKLPPQGFATGSQLEIYGRVKILPHSFYINLQEGCHVWPHPSIPLHLNPRFNTAMGENTFVRNAWLDGNWGQEERCPGFHFNPGAAFVLTIQKHADRFSVWVNHQLTGEFQFRGSVDGIDTVYIQGDVVLETVLYNTTHSEVCTRPECKISYCSKQCKPSVETK